MVSQLSISQNSYPREVKLGNDTVVCITYSQLKTINSEIELSEGKGEIIDSLDVALSLCDTSLPPPPTSSSDHLQTSTGHRFMCRRSLCGE